MLEAQAGRLAVGDFLDVLVSSQVFMLLDKEIDSDAWDDSASVMVLSNRNGVPMLAVFTSAERAVGWPAQLPQFGFGLLADFRWLLRGVGAGVGIVVNPGLSVGLELAAERVTELRTETLNG